MILLLLVSQLQRISIKGLLSLQISTWQFATLWICTVPALILASLRWQVGRDYNIYVQSFQSVLNSNNYRINNVPLESGFIALIKIIQRFTTDYIWMFAVVAVLINIGLLKAVNRLSVSPEISLCIFFTGQYYLHTLTVIRQWIVVPLFLYLLKDLGDRKWLKYIIAIILASFIHTSALVLIFFLFFAFIKIKSRQTAVLFTIATIAVSLAIIPIIFEITSSTKYSYYFTQHILTVNFPITTFVTTVLILVIGIYYYKGTNDDNYYTIMLWTQIITLTLCVLALFIPGIDRLIYYFTFVQIVFIPNIICRIKSHKLRLVWRNGLLLIYFISTLIVFFIQKQGNIIPYRSIFERF
jgi:hypothetical protein